MFKQIKLYHQNSQRYVHDVDIISTNQIAQLVELMTYLESLTWFMTCYVDLEDLLTHSKTDYYMF